MIDPNFLKDVDEGLSSNPKYLLSKYFYDDKGSELFIQIMNLPEYYLTKAEFEIFSQKSNEIIEAIGDSRFNIIELGAGDGMKTREFLKAIEEKGIATKYFPIDISGDVLDQLEKNVKELVPSQLIEPHEGDYFLELEKVYSSDIKEVVLFLGANIGNYTKEKAIQLLQLIGEKIKKGDILLLGVDLMKSPAMIASAYNDSQGVTKAFNLNLLERINREMAADFHINKFEFYSHYNPLSGEVRSFLVSLMEQVVDVPAIKKSFSFSKNELIYTELSKKYSVDDINELASAAGFKLSKMITDNNSYFAECILLKI